MVGVCVNAEFIENHEYSSWGGTKSHSVAGQIMLVGNPSAAELKLVVYLRNSSKVHYSHEIPKDFEFQHADDKSFTWSVLAKGSPRAKTYKLKFPNAQAKSQFHSAFKVYHERVVAEVQKIKAEKRRSDKKAFQRTAQSSCIPQRATQCAWTVRRVCWRSSLGTLAVGGSGQCTRTGMSASL